MRQDSASGFGFWQAGGMTSKYDMYWAAQLDEIRAAFGPAALGVPATVGVPDLHRMGARQSWYGTAEVHGREVIRNSAAHAVSLGRTVAASGICAAWPERTFRFRIDAACVLTITTADFDLNWSHGQAGTRHPQADPAPAKSARIVDFADPRKGEADAPGVSTGVLIRLLTDRSKSLSPVELLDLGSQKLNFPGLYTWWVDEQGAADLSCGLGQPLEAGLVYAGQAGATRWPAGKRSSGTLWTRIAGMHLGGPAGLSTFRRSLAAALVQVLALAGENGPGLSEWMEAHLRVITVPVPDADRLGEVESVVLAALDPPLNLRGRPSSPVRQRLSALRGIARSSR